MRRAWTGVVIVLLFGCVHTYKTQPQSRQPEPIRIDKSSSIYVTIPKDGRFGSMEYPQSGEMTAAAVEAALLRHSTNVELAKGEASLDEDLAAAAAAGSEYLLQPAILHWEERATEWSGKSDRITIRLALFEVGSRKRIATTEFSGKSRWGTFGGDHPQELLPVPVSRYVDQLFAAPEP